MGGEWMEVAILCICLVNLIGNAILGFIIWTSIVIMKATVKSEKNKKKKMPNSSGNLKNGIKKLKQKLIVKKIIIFFGKFTEKSIY